MQRRVTVSFVTPVAAVAWFLFAPPAEAQPAVQRSGPELRAVFDVGLIVTSIRPIPAAREGVHENDLGAVFAFSYRLTPIVQAGMAMVLEGNDTTGVNDLLIAPFSAHLGVMSPTVWLGDSIGASADAAAGLELVLANRSDNGGGPCIGCYNYPVDLSSGPFVETGLRLYFGKGKQVVPGVGVHYRVFKSSADFANRLTFTFSVGFGK
jgi:hypothetical protein